MILLYVWIYFKSNTNDTLHDPNGSTEFYDDAVCFAHMPTYGLYI